MVFTRGCSMKKSILVIASVLIISFVAYSFFTTPKTQASNSPYENEYYYNEDQLKDTNSMMDASNKNHSDKNISVYIDTEPSSYTVLINKEYGLPSDYIPPDLVIPDITFSFSGYKEKKLMRKEAADALASLFQAAKDENLTIYGVSGYRSYDRQLSIYNENVEKYGEEETNLFSAKAGHSEHQSGLSIDVSTKSIHNRLDETFAATPEGKFIKNHAHEYGFIVRYPKDKSEITGYSYEPWHIRYVGIDLATYLYENNLSLEEYYNYSPSEKISEDSTYGTAIDVEN